MSFDAASDSRLLRRLRDCLLDAARAVTFLEGSRLYGLDEWNGIRGGAGAMVAEASPAIQDKGDEKGRISEGS